MTEPQQAPIDLSDILDTSHENKWVAIAPDYRSVLAAADTLAELIPEVPDQNAIFHRVLPHDVSFAPASAR